MFQNNPWRVQVQRNLPYSYVPQEYSGFPLNHALMHQNMELNQYTPSPMYQQNGVMGLDYFQNGFLHESTGIMGNGYPGHYPNAIQPFTPQVGQQPIPVQPQVGQQPIPVQPVNVQNQYMHQQIAPTPQMGYAPKPTQSLFANPLQQQPNQINNPGMQYPNPYPKKSFMQKQQPSGIQSIMNQFKTQDGSIDINKMMNTAGQMMGTVNQVQGMFKGLGSFFKTTSV
jgi:YppG-like protein